MKIIRKEIRVRTAGNPDLKDITGELKDLLEESKLSEGMITVFVVGSTAAITTLEFEPGLIEDVRELYERIAPQNKSYHHDQTWGDSNGFSHLRASLAGPSLVIPFSGARMLLGTWQQVVLAEFDNRSRHRQIVVQLIGEE